MKDNAVAEALERLAKHWLKIERLANTETRDPEDDAFNIGRREGFSEAVQMLDMATGGDGEYRYCTIPNDRHCPTPVEMARRIIDPEAREAAFRLGLEVAARVCQRYVTPYGRAGSAPDACEGAVHKVGAAILAIDPAQHLRRE